MKDLLLEYIENQTQKINPRNLENFTANNISKKFDVSRNLISQYLNEYVKKEIIIKTHTRPVYFFSVQVIQDKYNVIVKEKSVSLDYILNLMNTKEKVSKDFHRLIGYEGSLSYVVKQCKSAITYPPDGLPILFYGPTGSGKSFMAELMYQYAINNNILDKKAKFITLNCSEYANNPELLSSNLFGHKKGSFTGADKDNIGLLKAAEGGMLFLDEIHGLSPESQEKLFLFMDKGIYHTVGDNENWYKSKVRLVFATTEKPEEVLLKTLLRRIAIISTIPSLESRPVEERKKLIFKIFKEESLKINKKIFISNAVYKTLILGKFQGNIGNLENVIRVACANAFLQGIDNEFLHVNIYNIPYSELANISYETIGINSNIEETMIDIDEINIDSIKNNKLITLYQDINNIFNYNIREKMNMGNSIDSFYEQLNKYYDHINYSNKTNNYTIFNFIQNTIENIFEIIIKQYKINMSHNDILSFSKLLVEYIGEYSRIDLWENENKYRVEILKENIKASFQKEYHIAEMLKGLIDNGLDIKLGDMAIVLLTLIIKSNNKEIDINRTPGIILSHGYSTASSIADATNKMIGHYVYDSIDMPLGISSEEIVKSVKEHLQRIGNFKKVILLVDMGSLEQIYNGIQKDLDIDIGIVNNINTRLALDIGFKLIKGDVNEEELKKACKENFSTYKFVRKRKREKIILSVCPTGIGTSEKIVELIYKSLPKQIDLKIIAMEYSQVIDKKLRERLMEEYEITLIIGTINPSLQDIAFISIEDLVTNQDIQYFNSIISKYLNSQEINIFNENIMKNFSLSNILNYLTILNGEKVLEVVKTMVDKVEKQLDIIITPKIKIGLYIHLSCLVERLVTKSEITSYNDMNNFVENHKEFIKIVKESFCEIEDLFSVEIPIEEIGYIFDYINNN